MSTPLHTEKSSNQWCIRVREERYPSSEVDLVTKHRPGWIRNTVHLGIMAHQEARKDEKWEVVWYGVSFFTYLLPVLLVFCFIGFSFLLRVYE